MHRLIALLVIFIALSCHRTEAGMMSVSASSPTTTQNLSADWVLDQEDDSALCQQLDSEAGLAGVPTCAVGGSLSAVALTQAFDRFDRFPVASRLSIVNRLLPLPPELDGLIKPPQA